MENNSNGRCSVLGPWNMCDGNPIFHRRWTFTSLSLCCCSFVMHVKQTYCLVPRVAFCFFCRVADMRVPHRHMTSLQRWHKKLLMCSRVDGNCFGCSATIALLHFRQVAVDEGNSVIIAFWQKHMCRFSVDALGRLRSQLRVTRNTYTLAKICVCQGMLTCV